MSKGPNKIIISENRLFISPLPRDQKVRTTNIKLMSDEIKVLLYDSLTLSCSLCNVKMEWFERNKDVLVKSHGRRAIIGTVYGVGNLGELVMAMVWGSHLEYLRLDHLGGFFSCIVHVRHTQHTTLNGKKGGNVKTFYLKKT